MLKFVGRVRNYWAASLAATAYGSWAMIHHLNSHSLLISIKAGAIQALFAFLSTLLLASVIRQLLSWKQGRLAPAVVFALTSAMLLLIPWSFHYWAATPNWFGAMLPGAVVGHFYVWYLVYYSEESAAIRVS